MWVNKGKLKKGISLGKSQHSLALSRFSFQFNKAS